MVGVENNRTSRVSLELCLFTVMTAQIHIQRRTRKEWKKEAYDRAMGETDCWSQGAPGMPSEVGTFELRPQ